MTVRKGSDSEKIQSAPIDDDVHLLPPLRGIEGMEIGVSHRRMGSGTGSRALHDIFRIGANLWGLAVYTLAPEPEDDDDVEGSVRASVRALVGGFRGPSEVLIHLNTHDRSNGQGVALIDSIVLGLLEFDACGAWVTVANAGATRPFVTRQAGWCDARGRLSDVPGLEDAPVYGDDLVGLGPHDALVVCDAGIMDARDGEGCRYGEEAFPDLLLRSTGASAQQMADDIVADASAFVGNALQADLLVMVLRVPEIERGTGLARVSRATGVPVELLELPGYPLGDWQPDHHRTSPLRREARFHLAPEPSSVPALRRLLRRLFRSWRLADGAESDIELLATEVATNAFATASSTATVIVRYDGERVRVEIGDGASERPRRTLPGYEALGGPGLLLVEALSSDWGVMRTRTGTRTWFEVSVGATTP